MKLEEITKEEWERLDKDSHYYFVNGCIKDEETDNLVAFQWYESAFAGPSKYYKVVEQECEK